MVKNPPASAGDTRDLGSVSGSGRFPDVENDNLLQHSSWKIPVTEKPGELQSVGLQRIRQDWMTEHNSQRY